MTTDHHNYQPGPTLPPLRPFSFPSIHPSAAQFSHHSVSYPLNRPAQSASPVSQSNQSPHAALIPTANRSNHYDPYHPYQHSKLSPRRDRDPARQPHSGAPQHAVDRQKNLSPHSTDQGNYTHSQRTYGHPVPPTSNSNPYHQQLKRTASRAELDHQSSRGRDEFRYSEDKLRHDQPPPNLRVVKEKEVFVKPEHLTPHLPSQSLPSQPTHPPSNACSDSSGCGGVDLSPRSPGSERHPAYPSRPCSAINPATSPRGPDAVGPKNSIKKRRMTSTNDGMLAKACNGHVSLTSSNQSSRSPDSRTVGRNSMSNHTPESFKDPVSPLVIGFIQPHNATAMQQVADTLKLREEQKRLIEQRRNSFAGQASLKSFSFTRNSAAASIGPPPPPSQDSQCSPRSARSHRGRTSISKPVPVINNNPNKNGLMKLLWHPGLPGSLFTNRPTQQLLYAPYPPTVNLSPINEAASRRHNSIPQLQQQAPPSQPALNQQTHHKLAQSPLISNDASPKHCPVARLASTLADRRGAEVGDKVKKLELTAQALQAHLVEQPSVRSAPIRGGFSQTNAPNGNLVQGPMISRQNLTARQGTNDRSHAPEFQNPFPTKFNSHHSSLKADPKQALRPNQPVKVRPAPGREHSGLAPDPYSRGLERRRTMHAGSLIQVPMLNPSIGKPSQGIGQASPAANGPPAAKVTHPNGQHGLRSSGHQNATHLSPSGAPLQTSSLQASFQHSPCNSPYLRQVPRSRSSAGSAGGPGIPSKHRFLQLFETFYDSLADCKILQSNLEDHERRSGQLLTLLQQSSGMFEKMLEERLAVMQKEFTRDIQVLEKRIDRLEDRTGSSDPSIDGVTNPGHQENTHSTLAALAKQEEDGRARRSASRSSGSGTGSAGEERTIASRLEKLEQEMRRAADVEKSQLVSSNPTAQTCNQSSPKECVEP